ncbi:hypothetical protein BJ912DRAFT_372379 [Pholiota molesta]|nr:hypothetical protein BJ912DRAFT_372379 [Pholiota molesta]
MTHGPRQLSGIRPHDSYPSVAHLMIIGQLTPPAPSSNTYAQNLRPSSYFQRSLGIQCSYHRKHRTLKYWIMGAMWMRQPRCLGISTLDRVGAANSIGDDLLLTVDIVCLLTQSDTYSPHLRRAPLTNRPSLHYSAVARWRSFDAFGCLGCLPSASIRYKYLGTEQLRAYR